MTAIKNYLPFLALLLLPLLLYPVVDTSAWRSSSDVHACLEFASALSAITAGIMVLVRFFTTGRWFFLSISIGFVLIGAVECVHGIFSFSRIWSATPPTFRLAISSTWLTGHLVLLAAFFLALVVGNKEVVPARRGRYAVVYNLAGLALAAVIAALIVTSPFLPNFVQLGSTTKKSIELSLAFFYFVAFVFYSRVYLRQRSRSPLLWSIIACIIFRVLAHVFVFEAQDFYDAHWDAAHLFVLLSYSFPVFGVWGETLKLHRSAQADVVALGEEMAERKQAEEALRQTTDRLTLATQAGGVGIWDFDIVRDILTWDDAMYRLYGITAEQFSGAYEAWQMGLHPDDKQRGDEETQLALQGIKDFDTEFRVLRPDGSVHDIRALGLVQRDAAGHPVRMIGTNWDITERKRADEELRLHSEVLAHMAEGVYLIRARDGVIVFANPAFEQMFGYDAGELVGKHVSAVNAPSERSAEDTARDIIQRLDADGRWDGEVRNIRKDGATFWCSAHVSAFEHPQHGTVWISIHQDITERKRAEAALVQAKDFAENLIQTANVIFVELNIRGEVVRLNPDAERITGYSQGEVAGKNWFEVLVPRDVYPEVWAEFARITVRGEVPRTFENPIRTKAGAERFIVWQNSLVFREGALASTISFGVDITERKRAEAEREALQAQMLEMQKLESVARLAGGIAHDFNNSLQIVLLNIEMLLATRDLSDVSRKRLLDIQETARHSSALTAQLLAFARRQVVRAQVLDLNDATEALVPTLQRLVGESIPVEWRPGATLWPVSLDPAQYQQVLVNLATNARDAIHGNGSLTIVTANVTIAMAEGAVAASPAPGQYVRLVIADDGPGMSGETLAHLFEPFYTTKGVGEGTGLGLASVFGVVKQNGGTIAVDSALGSGTTVTIHWPRLATAAKLPAEAPPILAPPRGTETVLVVEDEPKILEGCVSFLEALGYTVLSATLPSEALRVAEAHEGPIQLLLTDVVMPEMSGHALAARLTAARPTLRRLYMTGYADSVQRHVGMDEGIRLLNKPFTLDALAHAVRAVLDET